MTEDEIAEVMAEFAWECVNDVVGQSSWRWSDLEPGERVKAIETARDWLADRRETAE